MASVRLLIALCLALAVPPAVEGATIVCLGDSLTAGLGLGEDQAYPALVQALAQHEGLPWTVINAGISGDTTAGGLRRIDWLLKGKPDLMLIALGANDGMRGVPVAESRANLLAMLDRLDQARVKAALAGMLLPTNYGEDFRSAFAAIFPAVARERGVPLLPFLLAGVAGMPALNQADGIHPTAEGQRIIAGQVFAFLKTVVPAEQGAVSTVVLEVEGLGKRYATQAGTLDVLSGVSFRVDAGQSVAVTGPSGSGKSTLLGLIAGLDAPSYGRILVEGRDLAGMGDSALATFRGRRMGFIFQSFRLLPTLSAEENVRVPLELSGVPDARQLARQWLDRVGLSGRGSHLPSRLSGGEQQRVALARALAPRPALIFADEPTGNLDSRTGKEMADLLFSLVVDQASTLLLVTHDERLAERAGRILVLRDGQLVADSQSSAGAH